MEIEIITKNGRQWAIIPFEEYQTLVTQKPILEDSFSDIPLSIRANIESGDHPIKAFRTSQGISMRQLSRILDVTTAHLSQIESRKRRASLPLLCKIANILKTDIKNLIEI